jgi:hypothetical protein
MRTTEELLERGWHTNDDLPNKSHVTAFSRHRRNSRSA